MAESVTLGQDRTRALLDVLQLHGRWLQETNDDARLAVSWKVEPHYLVDFEILYSYAFSSQRQLDAASGANYLLESTEVVLWIGPGTALEMLDEFDRRLDLPTNMHAFRHLWDDPDVGSYDYQVLPQAVSGALAAVAERDEVSPRSGLFGLYLLTRLIKSGRIRMLDATGEALNLDLAPSLASSLDYLRPRFPKSNFADALNYAAVLDYRRVHEDVGHALFLLTNSQPLFNERLLPASDGVNHPISRDLSTAIYSALAFAHTGDALLLANQTLDYSLEAARLRASLIRSQLSAGTATAQVNEDSLVHAASTNTLEPATRNALSELSDLLSDPIILHAQDVFDDLHVVGTNIAKQRGEFDGIVSSTSRLLEFIIDLGFLIDLGGQAVADVADVALQVKELDNSDAGFVRHDVFSRDVHLESRPLMSIEKHDVDGDTEWLVNWPGANDSELVLDAFSTAYERHGLSAVECTFGFESEVEVWRVSIPLTLDDLIDLSNDERGVVWWLRLDADDYFSLYADLVARDAELSLMTIGVGGRRLNVEHVSDLQVRTSSRYVRREWIASILERLGVGGGS